MKKIIGIVMILIVVVTTINIINYNKMHSNKLSKTISYNGNNLMISIDGESSDSLPSSGTYYLNHYKCSDSNTKVKWNNDTHSLDLSNGNKSSCSQNV